MTKTDRDALRMLLAKTSKGPWHAGNCKENGHDLDTDLLACYAIRDVHGEQVVAKNRELIVVLHNSIGTLLDMLDAADNMRTVLGKLTGQLGYIDDTPDCWEHAFYHEGKAAADAYDAKVKL